MVNLCRVAMSGRVAAKNCSMRVLPASVRGMTAFEEGRFDSAITVPYATVKRHMVGAFKSLFGHYVLKAPNFKHILCNEEEETSKVILNPDLVQKVEDMSEEERGKMRLHFPETEELSQMPYTFKFENWAAGDLLDAVLGKEQSLSGYTQIGDILHLNLRDHHFPYKSVIGEILLRRVKNVRTVVNKAAPIDNTFRNFSMEVLAGEEREEYTVTVKHGGVNLTFDFAKVYFNPRLGTEHGRVTSLVGKGDVMLDVFAGVGPFSVACARQKKALRVYANDLNPDSFRWLKHNTTANKVADRMELHNVDGREFIQSVVRDVIQKRLLQDENDLGYIDQMCSLHIVMNLPAMAIEFLDTFEGLLSDAEPGCKSEDIEKVPIWVHVYGFSNEDDKVGDINRRCVESLGGEEPRDLAVSFVRNVATNKDMMRASFRLTADILLSDKCKAKKRKLQ